jgi:hypothetical protein
MIAEWFDQFYRIFRFVEWGCLRSLSSVHRIIPRKQLYRERKANSMNPFPLYGASSYNSLREGISLFGVAS